MEVVQGGVIGMQRQLSPSSLSDGSKGPATIEKPNINDRAVFIVIFPMII
jgi:hypothetical protein